MRRGKITAVLLALALAPMLWLLTGCGETPKAETGPAAPAVADRSEILLPYANGIINGEGQFVCPPDSSDYTYQIWRDCDGRTRYILSYDYVRSDTQLDDYGQPLVQAIRFSIYDHTGELAKSVLMNAARMDEYLAPDGDLQKGLLLANDLRSSRKYQLLDLDGNVLLEKQLEQQDYIWHASAWLAVTDEAVLVEVDLVCQDYVNYHFVDAYDRKQLQPLALPREYNGVTAFGYWQDRQYVAGEYLRAGYLSPGGSWLYDILDSRGQLLLSGLRSVDCMGDGLFIMEQGFSRGLMNDKGEWLYRESIFNELSD